MTREGTLDCPDSTGNITIPGQFALILRNLADIRAKMPENTANITYQGKMT